MIQFNKLRLSGFKSFADRTELDIGTGLNGIVGPNGCGKSNLVEALRWVMGENSAKRMRGGGMEDVIFAGTSKRSSKNIAEVSLLLNNESRSAPAQFNSADEIEIIRRIEKDHGSNYKINGKTVRARDVQMLLADTVTGANSPALVSQGRITQIINSKPLERRMVLEESAGVSGLYARRHEAELRLRAADANLVRLEDVLGGVESQLASLKRQARQATRYKNLNAQIRQLEALIAYLDWKVLEDRRNEMNNRFVEAEKIVSEKMLAVTQLTKTQTTQAENLPALRKAEAEAAAALQTKRIALQRIEDEAQRLDNMIAEAKEQYEQTLNDEQHERVSAEESAEMLTIMQGEEKTLLEEQKHDEARFGEKEKAKDDLEQKVTALEAEHTALMQNEAESRAKQAALEDQLQQNKSRAELLGHRLQKALDEKERLCAEQLSVADMAKKEKAAETLAEEIETNKTAIEALESDLKAHKEKRDEYRVSIKQLENQYSEVQTEMSMLTSFLSGDAQQQGALLDQVQAKPGFEKALSRALGDSLLAALDEESASYWVKTDIKAAMPTLPKGVRAIEPEIKAPDVLKLSLSQIGIVENEEQGRKAMHALSPGQAIVSQDGHYWRWDGYCVKASAKDRNAEHLEYKNKLASLEAKAPKLQKELHKQESAYEAIADSIRATESKLTDCREKIRTGERDLSQQYRDISHYKEKIARHNAEMASVEESIATATVDIDALNDIVRAEETQLNAYIEKARSTNTGDKDKVHAALIEARESYQEAVRVYDRHQQQQSTRRARLQAIADERVTLKNRNIRSSERLKVLGARKTELEGKLKELQAQPRNFETDKERFLSEISALEDARNEAAESLSLCENEVMETSKALKDAENALGEAREKRAHAQATLSGLVEQIDTIKMQIDDKFEMRPQDLHQHIAMDLAEIRADDLDGYKDKREKLIRERENLGAVNLRAEEEAQEIEAEAGKLIHERNDLVQAIEELRAGINKINKEARGRLLVAFDHVNAHFQHLFSRLFQGGQAHLELIESDDPLNSGLEIFAQPPGKSLQSLSLLSGGEQTLASIALIFAMFLTNPSPICVLDEIDAPLDDSNVDRLCDMLDEIAERGETRFLIVTHHRLTMARMDRLYGVTMAEKGVSQLVSVDLQQSFSFLDEAA
ncbi:MAG: chromosome segregation protein SMC [Micavibrio sp.]|nr:chromosome segregation protein SMC [Micavibrio sp.]|tara:strand:- start:1640 stop:5113 length:3474 start_codon:yes stop_codon:yes gene_type:complete